MKVCSVITILILSVLNCFSQPLRVHLMGGFANYSGDLQPARFGLKEAKGVIGLGATFNVTDKFAIRGDGSFAKIGADDKNSSNPVFRARNLNFKTIIQEVSLMGEYDLFNSYDRAITPYVFAGIGVFHASAYTFDSLNRKVYLAGIGTEAQGSTAFPARKVFKTIQLNVPVGGGLKYTLSNDIQLSLEVGVRFIGSDYLDDVSRSYVDPNFLLANYGPRAVQFAHRGGELKSNPQPYPQVGSMRGTVKGNDYYYFGQFRMSFRLNWFGNSDRNSYQSGLRRLGCPTKM